MRRLYGLPEDAMIDMGDFAGGVLKYLRRHPVPRLTVAGGFAKMAKLAPGHARPALGPVAGRPAALADARRGGRRASWSSAARPPTPP